MDDFGRDSLQARTRRDLIPPRISRARTWLLDHSTTAHDFLFLYLIHHPLLQLDFSDFHHLHHLHSTFTACNFHLLQALRPTTLINSHHPLEFELRSHLHEATTPHSQLSTAAVSLLLLTSHHLHPSSNSIPSCSHPCLQLQQLLSSTSFHHLLYPQPPCHPRLASSLQYRSSFNLPISTNSPLCLRWEYCWLLLSIIAS